MPSDRRLSRRVLASLLLLATAHVLRAQSAVTSARPVLFVCEHGTVRSLIARLEFDRYARHVGLRMPAESRGTQPDSALPAWMAIALARDSISIGIWRPQRLLSADLMHAAIVVSFDVPDSATALTHVPRQQWNGLPSVSRNYAEGRDAIRARVHRLVDSLRSAQPPR